MINQLITQLNEKDSKKKLPYFSFNFMKYYTHDLLYVPSGFDLGLRDMIHNYEKKGYLNNTMLIFFSDHGHRMSSFGRATDQGKMEKSMPFLGMRLPNQMRNTEYARNFKNNRNKLISTFDLYKTLKHFYYINKYGLQNSEINSKNCRNYFQNSNHSIRSLRGISLFENIPSKRGCLNAIVQNAYCLCNPKVVISEKKFYEETKYDVISASRILAKLLNKITDKVRDKCEMFTIQNVIKIKKSVFSANSLYEFQFAVQPGDAVFEATLKYEAKKSELLLHDRILRTSLYKKQSDCMKKHEYYGFCFCKTTDKQNDSIV